MIDLILCMTHMSEGMFCDVSAYEVPFYHKSPIFYITKSIL